MNKIAVCVPAGDMVHTAFAFDVAKAIAWHVITHPKDHVLPIFQPGTILADIRKTLVDNALKEDCTHVLFVDSDMRFPKDTIQRLLDADVPVIAANCARRRMPTSPTATQWDKAQEKATRIYTFPETTGYQEVDTIGCGVMMVKTEVFREVPRPWFQMPWHEKLQCFVGEDIYFCRSCQSRGIPIYIDHDLSKEIGHLGEWEFKHEHTWAVRELVAAKDAEADAKQKKEQEAALVA